MKTIIWIYLGLGTYELTYWLLNGGSLPFVLAVGFFTSAVYVFTKEDL